MSTGLTLENLWCPLLSTGLQLLRPGWTSCWEEEEEAPSLPPPSPHPPSSPARSRPPSLFLLRGCRSGSRRSERRAPCSSPAWELKCTERGSWKPSSGAAGGGRRPGRRAQLRRPWLWTQRARSCAEGQSALPAGLAGAAAGSPGAGLRKGARRRPAGGRGQSAERPGSAKGAARPVLSSAPATVASGARRAPGPERFQPTAGGVPPPGRAAPPRPAARCLAGACEREGQAAGRRDALSRSRSAELRPRASARPISKCAPPRRAPITPSLAKFDTRAPAFLGTRWSLPRDFPSWAKFFFFFFCQEEPILSDPLQRRPVALRRSRVLSEGSGCRPLGGGVRALHASRASGVLYPLALSDPPALSLSPQPDQRVQFKQSQPELRCPRASPTWGSGTRNAELRPGVHGQPGSSARPSHGSGSFPADQPGAASRFSAVAALVFSPLQPAPLPPLVPRCCVGGVPFSPLSR